MFHLGKQLLQLNKPSLKSNFRAIQSASTLYTPPSVTVYNPSASAAPELQPDNKVKVTLVPGDGKYIHFALI